MRRALAMGLLAVGLSFLLPVLLPPKATGDRAPASHLRPPAQTAERGDGDVGVRVLLADGSVERMSRADYLWGVVAAEMPASFHTEALKAQAVAARTYLVCAKQDKHPGAEICADSKCCQAYVSRAEAEAGWGERAGEYGAKLSEAVDGTDGLVLLYEGRPIQALYFSSAPGSTVDARAVWGDRKSVV